MNKPIWDLSGDDDAQREQIAKQRAAAFGAWLSSYGLERVPEHPETLDSISPPCCPEEAIR